MAGHQAHLPGLLGQGFPCISVNWKIYRIGNTSPLQATGLNRKTRIIANIRASPNLSWLSGFYFSTYFLEWPVMWKTGKKRLRMENTHFPIPIKKWQPCALVQLRNLCYAYLHVHAGSFWSCNVRRRKSTMFKKRKKCECVTCAGAISDQTTSSLSASPQISTFETGHV